MATDEGYEAGERRPIASRELAASRAAARWLAARGISPNAISVVGMCACVAAGVLVATTTSGPTARLAWLGVAILVQIRLLANMLDGMVAVESGRASRVGELYNEVPDRISDGAVFVGLAYAAGGHEALGWLAAFLAVFVAYVRVQARVAGAPQDYGGPMAKQHRMFVVTITALWCAIAPAAWRLDLDGEGAGVPAIALGFIALGSAVTAVRRLWSAARFLEERGKL